ncbi:ABC transporter permease subunit [Nocardia sp. R6R-6]|uniref:ABC transporter permease subunit n=1 Tax=Nocardia sp. R6R-6 TaxID=3459303 RepID=UPI00403D8739
MNTDTRRPARVPARSASGGAIERSPWWHALSVRRISAVYLLVVIVVLFSVWAPATFPHPDTIRQVLNANAVIGLAALALCVPLATRVFDLSFAFTMSLAGVTATRLVVDGKPVWLAASVALLAAGAVGLLNAFVVIVLGVESLIATLGTGSLVQALIIVITKEESIQGSRLGEGFAEIGQRQVFGFTMPVIYMLVAAIVLWYMLEHTPLGRKLYATGFNADAARLAGVPTTRLRFCSLIVSATVAGWAGTALASVLSSGSPTAGTPYLLPAFAAAFLGATQLKMGRFNAWGTVVAVIVLGTGTTGLALVAAPPWAADVFTGFVLITALAMTAAHGKQLRSG